MTLQALQSSVRMGEIMGSVAESDLQAAAGTQLDPTEVEFLNTTLENPSLDAGTQAAIRKLLATMPRTDKAPLGVGDRLSRIGGSVVAFGGAGAALTSWTGPGALIGAIGGSFVGLAVGLSWDGPVD